MNKMVAEEFSEQIELLKIDGNFQTYIETIEHVIENNIYDTIPLAYSTINQYLTKSLKDKLLIEYSDKGMISKKHQKKTSNVLF
jgi:hypothetical protein